MAVDTAVPACEILRFFVVVTCSSTGFGAFPDFNFDFSLYLDLDSDLLSASGLDSDNTEVFWGESIALKPGRAAAFFLMSFPLFLSLAFLLFFSSTSISTLFSSSDSNELTLGPEEEEPRLFFLTSFCLYPILDFFFVLAVETGGAAGFESESELEPEDDDDEEDEEDERFEESLSVSSFFAAAEGRIFESDGVSSFEGTSGSWSLDSSSITFESDHFVLDGSESADLTLSLSHSCPQMSLVK